MNQLDETLEPRGADRHAPFDTGQGAGDGKRAGGSERPLISVVVPCYNEEEVFPLLAERLTALADSLSAELDCECELVFVDDGSGDSTWPRICELAGADQRVKGAKLSRNFGQQAALTCGYHLANGDAVACLDADLQDPPEVVSEMVERWRAGADVVYGIRERRDGETRLKLLTARAFYWLIRVAGAKHIPVEAGDFRLLSRRSLDAVLRLDEQHGFMRGLVSWVGFPTAEVRYERHPRAAGTTKWPLRNMLRLALGAFYSFTRLPLRLTYYALAGLSLVSLAYLAYVLTAVVGRGAAPASLNVGLLLAVIAFGAMNLFSQAILGQYVARTYEQCQGRPLYIVQEMTGGQAPLAQPAWNQQTLGRIAAGKSPIKV